MTDELLSSQLFRVCLGSLEPGKLLANILAVETEHGQPLLRIKGRNRYNSRLGELKGT